MSGKIGPGLTVDLGPSLLRDFDSPDRNELIYTILEILTSEKRYCESLRTLLDVYYVHTCPDKVDNTCLHTLQVATNVINVLDNECTNEIITHTGECADSFKVLGESNSGTASGNSSTVVMNSNNFSSRTGADPTGQTSIENVRKKLVLLQSKTRKVGQSFTEEVWNSIFGGLDAVYAISFMTLRSLYDNFEMAKNSYASFIKEEQSGMEGRNKYEYCLAVPVGEVFCRFIERSLMTYKFYVAKYDKAVTELRAARKSSEVSKRLKELMTLAQGNDLESLLIRPVQKVPRYVMMLNKVQKLYNSYQTIAKKQHPDLNSLTSAIKHIDKHAHVIDKYLDEHKGLEQIRLIDKNIMKCNQAIVTTGRKFIRMGIVTKVCRKANKPRVMILFSDALVYCIEFGLSLKNVLPSKKEKIKNGTNSSGIGINDKRRESSVTEPSINIESSTDTENDIEGYNYDDYMTGEEEENTEESSSKYGRTRSSPSFSASTLNTGDESNNINSSQMTIFQPMNENPSIQNTPQSTASPGTMQFDAAFKNDEISLMKKKLIFRQLIYLKDCRVIADKYDETKFQILTSANTKNMKSYQFISKDRNAWYEAVKECIEKNKDSTSKEQIWAPIWIPDSKVKNCQFCNTKFTTILRKHHCRACGSIICKNCSKNYDRAEYTKLLKIDMFSEEEKKARLSGDEITQKTCKDRLDAYLETSEFKDTTQKMERLCRKCANNMESLGKKYNALLLMSRNIPQVVKTNVSSGDNKKEEDKNHENTKRDIQNNGFNLMSPNTITKDRLSNGMSAGEIISMQTELQFDAQYFYKQLENAKKLANTIDANTIIITDPKINNSRTVKPILNPVIVSTYSGAYAYVNSETSLTDGKSNSSSIKGTFQSPMVGLVKSANKAEEYKYTANIMDYNKTDSIGYKTPTLYNYKMNQKDPYSQTFGSAPPIPARKKTLIQTSIQTTNGIDMNDDNKVNNITKIENNNEDNDNNLINENSLNDNDNDNKTVKVENIENSNNTILVSPSNVDTQNIPPRLPPKKKITKSFPDDNLQTNI